MCFSIHMSGTFRNHVWGGYFFFFYYFFNVIYLSRYNKYISPSLSIKVTIPMTPPPSKDSYNFCYTSYTCLLVFPMVIWYYLAEKMIYSSTHTFIPIYYVYTCILTITEKILLNDTNLSTHSVIENKRNGKVF